MDILSGHIAFISGLVILMILRIVFARKYSENAKKGAKDPKEALLLILLLLGFQIIPLLYLLTNVFSFAEYTLPDWAFYTALPFGVIGIYTFYRSHVDLRDSWSPLIYTNDELELITTGIYKYFRHPMYGSHMYWFIAQILLLPNYIAGFSGLLLIIPFLLYRIPREEKAMIEQFGEKYQNYKNQTYALIPFL